MNAREALAGKPWVASQLQNRAMVRGGKKMRRN